MPVGFHDLSPLKDRALIEVTETAGAGTDSPAVNKGGTALMTPFADESWQRAFFGGYGTKNSNLALSGPVTELK